MSSSGLWSGASGTEGGDGFRDVRLLEVGGSEPPLDGTAVFVVGTTDGLPVLPGLVLVLAAVGGWILGPMMCVSGRRGPDREREWVQVKPNLMGRGADREREVGAL